MATTTHSPTVSESRRFPIRPLWIGLAAFVLIVMAIGLQAGMPIYRQQSAQAMIKRVKGEFQVQKGGPDWLRRWIGDERMTVFDVVERAQLRGRPVTDPDVAKLRGLTSLHFVSLGRTQVTDTGLGYFRELTGVQGAGFDGTQITDAGLLHLGGLTNLQFLTLDDTQITDAGIAHLKDLTGLQSLSLANTAVTDSGLAHLKGLPHLRNLRIPSTRITDSGIADLQRALPELEIYR